MFLQIERDIGRLVDCRARMNFSPLGACALAGTGLPIDRFMTSEALGFTAPLRNRYSNFHFICVNCEVSLCSCACHVIGFNSQIFIYILLLTECMVLS